MTFKYDFAISFAGEQRDTAEKIANLLMEKNARVYYDRFFEGEMLGKKLSTYFHQKFGVDAKYVIILISKEYPHKDWTNWELSIARDEAKKRKEEFILPIRIDSTKILGIHDDIGFIDLREKSIAETVNILLEKLDKKKLEEDNEDIAEIFDVRDFKDEARALLSKVNKTHINLSEILQEFYDFLIKIDEKEEIRWVEAELSGEIYKVGKLEPEFFAYREIKGYLSPYQISFGFYTLDMIISEPKYLMKPFNYIPSLSIFELEKYAYDLDKVGILTLSKEVAQMIGLDTNAFPKLYLYFKPSEIVHIISNIKQKISRFLINIIKK